MKQNVQYESKFDEHFDDFILKIHFFLIRFFCSTKKKSQSKTVECNLITNNESRGGYIRITYYMNGHP